MHMHAVYTLIGINHGQFTQNQLTIFDKHAIVFLMPLSYLAEMDEYHQLT